MKKILSITECKNSLTKELCLSLLKKKIPFEYYTAEDNVLDDKIMLWNGKRNTLTITVCDSYMFGRDFFRVIKSGYKGDVKYDTVAYEGSHIRSVVRTIERIRESFQKKKEYFLKNKNIKS